MCVCGAVAERASEWVEPASERARAPKRRCSCACKRSALSDQQPVGHNKNKTAACIAHTSSQCFSQTINQLHRPPRLMILFPALCAWLCTIYSCFFSAAGPSAGRRVHLNNNISLDNSIVFAARGEWKISCPQKCGLMFPERPRAQVFITRGRHKGEINLARNITSVLAGGPLCPLRFGSRRFCVCAWEWEVRCGGGGEITDKSFFSLSRTCPSALWSSLSLLAHAFGVEITRWVFLRDEVCGRSFYALSRVLLIHFLCSSRTPGTRHADAQPWPTSVGLARASWLYCAQDKYLRRILSINYRISGHSQRTSKRAWHLTKFAFLPLK